MNKSLNVTKHTQIAGFVLFAEYADNKQSWEKWTTK